MYEIESILNSSYFCVSRRTIDVLFVAVTVVEIIILEFNCARRLIRKV